MRSMPAASRPDMVGAMNTELNEIDILGTINRDQGEKRREKNPPQLQHMTRVEAGEISLDKRGEGSCQKHSKAVSSDI